MDLASKLGKFGEDPAQRKKPTGPVWEGPNGDGPNGGITYSLLNRYLACKERFRLLVVGGLRSADHFSHRLEYGNMFHLCEEEYLRIHKDPTASKNWRQAVYGALTKYANELCVKYPLDREKIQHWMSVCVVQFPVYVEYWRTHKDTVQARPLLQECKFNVQYELPSGRMVRLRGKWDSVDMQADRKGIWLQENKTKGEIDERQLKRQLTFDMQTMLYLVALTNHPHKDYPFNKIGGQGGITIQGVRYNVIRRPLSGGKGTIVRKKGSAKTEPESMEDYYERVRQYIIAEPETYFMRFPVYVTADTLMEFRKTCLDPILEGLLDWWDWVKEGDPWRDGNRLHSRTAFGLYSPLMEGEPTELDEYLASGSTIGLGRTDNLFPELG